MESLPAFTPHLEMETLFILSEQGRISSTREPNPLAGPRFMLITGARTCAWATRVDIPDRVTRQIQALTRNEPPDLRQQDPVHVELYKSLIGGRPDSGPAFTFPDGLPAPAGIVTINYFSQLGPHFNGWTPDEIPDRSPILAIIRDGAPVSICFCARQAEAAAEAGLETAPEFRGRGFGAAVTSAWAEVIRASGRIPIYSTSWSNSASLAVARKLGLRLCATHWSLSD